MDILIYSSAYFQVDNYQVLYSDSQDKFFVEEIMKYKMIYPELKVILSIGGKDFPSSDFSTMASTNKSRDLFIISLKEFLKEKKFDGVDISWKWPCSSQKMIYKRQFKNVILACDVYKGLLDKGSQCPEDAQNLLLLLKELREGLGNSTLITVTGSPSPRLFKQLPLKSCAGYVDYWLVETYGYTDSATNGSHVTAPIAPLRHPAKSLGFNSQNVNSTGRLEYSNVLCK